MRLPPLGFKDLIQKDKILKTENYYSEQFKKPYESTKEFTKWLENINFITKDKAFSCLDLGSGMGETIFYFARKYPKSIFVGVEKKRSLVLQGKVLLKNKKNIKIIHGNMFTYKPKKIFDLTTSLATISWIKDSKKAIHSLAKIARKKIAFTSLMYKGPIECNINVHDFSGQYKDKKSWVSPYNIISIPKTIRQLRSYGFKKFYFKKFNIKKRLKRPNHGGMGTFTVMGSDKRLIQFSGPLHMPWYFFAAKR